ncbi:hypothetical protein BDZ45DRAFT_805111 [Acephala macrosclerotiorum]|nr:hypothetical protein BDZ45DRAFT_805111 [Acephala macrosclerotiorum]
MSESPAESTKTSNKRLESETPHSNFTHLALPSARLPDSQNSLAPRRTDPSSKSLADAAAQPSALLIHADGHDGEHHRTIMVAEIDFEYQNCLQESQRETQNDKRLQECETWSTAPMNLDDPQATKSTKKASDQLVAWVYETSDSRLVMAERLERKKWDLEQCGSGSNL